MEDPEENGPFHSVIPGKVRRLFQRQKSAPARQVEGEPTTTLITPFPEIEEEDSGILTARKRKTGLTRKTPLTATATQTPTALSTKTEKGPARPRTHRQLSRSEPHRTAGIVLQRPLCEYVIEDYAGPQSVLPHCLPRFMLADALVADLGSPLSKSDEKVEREGDLGGALPGLPLFQTTPKAVVGDGGMEGVYFCLSPVGAGYLRDPLLEVPVEGHLEIPPRPQQPLPEESLQPHVGHPLSHLPSALPDPPQALEVASPPLGVDLGDPSIQYVSPQGPQGTPETPLQVPDQAPPQYPLQDQPPQTPPSSPSPSADQLDPSLQQIPTDPTPPESPAPPDLPQPQSTPDPAMDIKEEVSYCFFCSLSGLKMKLTVTTDGNHIARFCRKCSLEDPPIGSKLCTNPTCRKVILPSESMPRRCPDCSGVLYTKKR